MQHESASDVPSDTLALGQRWRTLAIAGVVVALLGVLAIAMPFATGISIALVLGAVLIVAGVVHGAHAITTHGWTGRLWQLALAIVSVVAGAILVLNPLVGLASLTLLAIAYLLVDAATELWMAVQLAGQPGRGAIAASGALSLVLAAMLWIGFPADATWAIGTLVGIGLFVTGLSMVAVASAGRKLGDDTPSPATEPRGA